MGSNLETQLQLTPTDKPFPADRPANGDKTNLPHFEPEAPEAMKLRTRPW